MFLLSILGDTPNRILLDTCIIIKKAIEQGLSTLSVPMQALCAHSSKSNTYIWVVNGKALVRNKHQKAMHYNEIGLCAQITTIVRCSQVNTIGRACSIAYQSEMIFIVNSLSFLYFNQNLETWSGSLRGAQLVTKQDDSWYDPTTHQSCAWSWKCPQ